MSLFRRAFGGQETRTADIGGGLLPSRVNYSQGAVFVNSETALQHPAVFAALDLRAGLVSTTPLDAYRMFNGVQVEIPQPLVLRSPGGPGCDLAEWLYSTQFEIDRTGNTFGIITKFDGNNLPGEIELVPSSAVTVRGKGMQVVKYVIAGTEYDPSLIWHEKGNTLAGWPIGLNPIAYASATIGGYLSAQKFANDWFAAGPHPKGTLKNLEADVLPPAVTAETKARFKEATANGDIFVTGKNWEYTPEQQTAANSVFLDGMKYGIVDIARFFGVPAELIDGGVSGQSVTYASVSSKNLQFLVNNLNKAYVRRERALSRLLAAPRFVKFNTDAILRMDPETREKLLIEQVRGRTLAPSEARAISNRAPFTEDQMSEFDKLFGRPGVTYRITENSPGGVTLPPEGQPT